LFHDNRVLFPNFSLIETTSLKQTISLRKSKLFGFSFGKEKRLLLDATKKALLILCKGGGVFPKSDRRRGAKRENGFGQQCNNLKKKKAFFYSGKGKEKKRKVDWNLFIMEVDHAPTPPKRFV
jgi:hypothetical protein